MDYCSASNQIKSYAPTAVGSVLLAKNIDCVSLEANLVSCDALTIKGQSMAAVPGVIDKTQNMSAIPNQTTHTGNFISSDIQVGQISPVDSSAGVTVLGKLEQSYANSSGGIDVYLTNSSVPQSGTMGISMGQSKTTSYNAWQMAFYYAGTGNTSNRLDFKALGQSATMSLISGKVGINTTAPSEALDVSGNLKISGTSSLTGAITAGSNITMSGSSATASLKTTTVTSLTNTGNETITGTLGVTGATTVTSLTNTGNETITGTLGVTGAITAASNITMSGTGATASLKATTVTSLTNSGSETITGTLGVTGATTVTSLSASGNVTISGTVSATSQIAASIGQVLGNLAWSSTAGVNSYKTENILSTAQAINSAYSPRVYTLYFTQLKSSGYGSTTDKPYIRVGYGGSTTTWSSNYTGFIAANTGSALTKEEVSSTGIPVYPINSGSSWSDTYSHNGVFTLTYMFAAGGGYIYRWDYTNVASVVGGATTAAAHVLGSGYIFNTTSTGRPTALGIFYGATNTTSNLLTAQIVSAHIV
jgi:hypothetical protein